MAGNIDQIVLKIASRCNLNCSYCYIYNHEDQSWRERPRFISDEVFERTLVAIRQYCERREDHQMQIVFHGGEPTLIGPERFDHLASRAKEELGGYLSSLCIQTNATLINDEWIDVLKCNDIGVGVSLDGPPEVHDAARVDHLGRGSYARTVEGLARLQEAGLEPNALSVVNPGYSGLDAYRHLRKLGINRFGFLLPDVSHDNKARFYGHLGATPVADFLIPIFDAWFAEDDPEIRVGPFWGLLRSMMGGSGDSDAFGNSQMGYLVVETDGSIEALDALRVCESGIAQSGLNVLRNGFDDLRLGLPLVHRAVHEGMPLPSLCEICHERDVCGGGYLPHRYSRANGFDNPSVWCADILRLFGHIRSQVGELAVA
jgi:uncharacterized protein